MIETTGWLLDLFDHPQQGMVLWLIGKDGCRHRFHQPFPITFYAAGPARRLRAFWRWLQEQPEKPSLARGERRDLFQSQPVTVLAATVQQPSAQPWLFRRAAKAFPDLDYYDADIQLSLRFAARTGAFPLAICHLRAADSGLIEQFEVLDTPWEIDPQPPPLRILRLAPNCDPRHVPPESLHVRGEHVDFHLPFDPPRPLLINLRAILKRQDPDLLLTEWGDTWLLPLLLEMARQTGLPLPLHRERGRSVTLKAERTYFSYGQIIYKGQQIHLYGRAHIDQRNAVLWNDYGLEGSLEAARVTCLPLQTAARTSPGTGISAMQTLTALRTQVLVPWHKQQAEKPKTALDLLRYDQGGLIYQPTMGLHEDVGMVDFVSMYPSIMVHCNISPEVPAPTALGESPHPPGLVPQTLAPLLVKRVTLKQRAASLPAWHPQRALDKARSQAHKWLLVTCFGYLGYKNARFGRIESHEQVTTWGREALLQAKEAAEDLGFTVLHMYVDGLWVKKEGCRAALDFQPLLEEITRRTHLPVGMDGVFRWVAFLPSRLDSRVPVANRYFGIYHDGSLKVRGIETRRRDTPSFIGILQMELLEYLAGAGNRQEMTARIPEAIVLLQRALKDLRAGRVPPQDLLVAQCLSRELAAYKDPSPAARAAAQLEAVGKHVRPGMRLRFLLLQGEPGVRAWDLPGSIDPHTLDLERYRELTLRAASSIFQPLGVDESLLKAWVDGKGISVELEMPHLLHTDIGNKSCLPCPPASEYRQR